MPDEPQWLIDIRLSLISLLQDTQILKSPLVQKTLKNIHTPLPSGELQQLGRELEHAKHAYEKQASVGLYLLLVMILYKLTGKPKPNVVIDLPAKKRANPANREVLPIDESDGSD